MTLDSLLIFHPFIFILTSGAYSFLLAFVINFAEAFFFLNNWMIPFSHANTWSDHIRSDGFSRMTLTLFFLIQALIVSSDNPKGRSFSPYQFTNMKYEMIHLICEKFHHVNSQFCVIGVTGLKHKTFFVSIRISCLEFPDQTKRIQSLLGQCFVFF